LRSSTEAPERIERLSAVTSPVVTKRSLCLMTSHCPSPFVFTSANDPFTFSPRNWNESFPLASPLRTSSSAQERSPNAVAGSSGEYTPQSQTMTSPAPYCFAGMIPSNEA